MAILFLTALLLGACGGEVIDDEVVDEEWTATAQAHYGVTEALAKGIGSAGTMTCSSVAGSAYTVKVHLFLGAGAGQLVAENLSFGGVAMAGSISIKGTSPYCAQGALGGFAVGAASPDLFGVIPPVGLASAPYCAPWKSIRFLGYNDWKGVKAALNAQCLTQTASNANASGSSTTCNDVKLTLMIGQTPIDLSCKITVAGGKK